MATPRICSIDDCGKPAKARGWCAAHWARWRRNGDPLALSSRELLGEKYKRWLCEHERHDADDCLIWPFPRPGRYATFYVDGRNRSAHRMMCELVNGPEPFSGAFALHSCGKGHLGCVNPKHLRWGTHLDNMDDKREHGRTSRGSRHGKSKLAEAEVLAIRSRRARGDLMKDIAADFGITRQAVRQIVDRITWRHVP